MLEALDMRRDGINDQASGLRRLLAPRGLRILPVSGAASDQDQARVVAQLAAWLGSTGRHVILVDQSCGAVSNYFGLRARYELSHVLCGDRAWDQVLLEGPQGVAVLPAARGLARLETERARRDLFSQLYALPMRPDVVLLNLSAAAQGSALADPLGDWLFVASAGAGGLMPAYGEIKRLVTLVRPQCVQVLVDGAHDAADAHIAFGNLAATARRFLDLDLNFCGNVQRSIAQYAPHDDVPGALRQLAADLDGWRLRSYVPAAEHEHHAPTLAYAASPSWS
jgi:flagellar biosynthesis protein FlhG